MASKSALYITVMGALIAPVLAGCTFHASGQAGGGKEPAAPPPPPAAEPAPAPAPAPAAEEPAPAPEPKTAKAKPKMDKEGRVKIPGNIVFDTGKATLKSDSGSEQTLQELKQFLDDNPPVTKLRIEGHTDNVGNDANNMTLSAQRALTIKKWLIDKGIKPERLLAVGFGESRPIADNPTAEGKAQNRRTEFHVAELRGKRYLGKDPTGGGKVLE